MRTDPILHLALVAMLGLALGAAGCDDDDDDGDLDDQTGGSCETAADCYAGVDTEAMPYPPICMDRVETGYCTHSCVTDADCCSVEGECDDGRPQVCAPFESTGEYYCFLSCEDVPEAEEADYCATYANADFGCRSTGGGSDNRKVCVP